MPEGPEIRREADKIQSALVGKVLEDVYFGLPQLTCYAPMFEGVSVLRVRTRGKALLTRFDNGLTMYSHNQLYGVWKVCDRDKPPKTNRSLRVALHTADQSALLYSASSIEMIDSALEEKHPFIARLGPDVLDPELHWRNVAEQLMNKRFAGRSLAALYLDQGFMAGIGNYLRSEILFDACLSHTRRPNSLTRRQLGRLSRSTLTISQRAYATGGVTNRPSLVKALRRAGATRRYYRFAVFARNGLPCYQCGTEIVRTEVSSRRLYYCPSCQPPA